MMEILNKDQISGEDAASRKKDHEDLVAEYEAAIINMFGLLRVLMPKRGQEMDDFKTLIKEISPLSIRINQKIREDAAERVIGYLSGMGYVIDEELAQRLKEASHRFRRLEENERTTKKSTEQTSKDS